VSPSLGLTIVWIVWLISWLAAAAWSNRAVTRPGVQHEILYRVAIVAGVCLLFGFFPGRPADDRALWRLGSNAGWAMAGLALCGLLFTWWARLYLGRLWSSSVTRKADHRVVDGGPYSLVRHPIYTGVIVATVATAMLRGTALAWLGVAVMSVGWYLKARLEERFLRAQLGADDYDGYARRVPMLVPFTRSK
jgi:protein-S-isoprenylcysteine O-methyltransferase Ste14